MEHYLVEKTTLTDIANAIRTKRGSSAPLSPKAMPSEILQLEDSLDTSDATATAEDLLLGTTAYANSEKLTGKNITVKIIPDRTGNLLYYSGTEFVKESLTSGTSVTIQIQKGSGFVIESTGSRSYRSTSTGTVYTYSIPQVTASGGSRCCSYRSMSMSNYTNFFYSFLIRVTEDNATVTLSTVSSLVTS